MITNVGPTAKGSVLARIVDLQTGQSVWQEELRQTIPAGISYWERSIVLDKPKLWWPNGMGGQPLYRLGLSCVSQIKNSTSLPTGSASANWSCGGIPPQPAALAPTAMHGTHTISWTWR